ncbi:MAG: ACP S-malonyltransferase [Actinomycetota bacterium]
MNAWIFPGQGSQFVGMGAGLGSEAARETFTIAKEVLGWDVRAVCLEGPQDVLAATEAAQPAILTVSVAAARSLEAAGSFPDVVAGHSVGEFAALVAAHALSFEDALRAVCARADAMAAAGRITTGGMAAILGLRPDEVEDACTRAGGEVGVAAINAPTQVVVSGESNAVEELTTAARNAGARRVIPLDVSVAAHSTLMEPAAAALEEALARATILPPIVPFVSCVVGRAVDDPVEISELLSDALTRPVRWVDTIHALEGIGALRFFEVGPGRVLAGLMRGIIRDAETTAVGDDDAIARLTGALAGDRRS